MTESDSGSGQAQDPADAMAFRFYRDGDEEGLLRLFSQAFARWPVPELTVPAIDHLRWKLRSHELSTRHQIVGEIDARIVAARIHVLHRIKIRSDVRVARQSIDTSVLPEYQRTGVMTKFKKFGRDEIISGYDFGYFYNSGHPGMKRLVPKQTIATEHFGNETVALAHDLSGGGRSPGEAAWSLREVPEFDERIDAFWRDASEPFDFIIVRDKRFLAWRFDRRGGRYQIVLAEDAGRILGYVVLATSRERGYIADLLALPDRLDVVESLIDHALATFRAAEVASVACLVQRRHPYREALLRLGFTASKHAIRFAYQPLALKSPELSLLHDPGLRVHATYLDTDLV